MQNVEEHFPLVATLLMLNHCHTCPWDDIRGHSFHLDQINRCPQFCCVAARPILDLIAQYDGWPGDDLPEDIKLCQGLWKKIQFVLWLIQIVSPRQDHLECNMELVSIWTHSN